MELSIRAEGFSVTQALRTFVEDRIRLRFDRFANRVRRIVVLLRDENGPRGGVDKQCKVHVELQNGTRLIRECTHVDAYTACSDGVGRTQRALADFIRRSGSR